MLVAGKRKDNSRDKAILVHGHLEEALAMIDTISGFTQEQINTLRDARAKIVGASAYIASFVGQRERMTWQAKKLEV